jgi:hypothetical protein
VTTVSADRQSWPWPDSLDALSAAPDHHKLLLENGSVRVLDVRIPAAQGNVLLDTRVTPFPSPRPAAEWLLPVPPHSIENVGTSEIHLLSVESERL